MSMLSEMLNISCVLLFISTSFAAAVSRAASGTTSIAPFPADTSGPICVNSLQHHLWDSHDGKALNPSDCAYALLGVKLSLGNDSKASFNFYSKDDLSIAPPRGWGLPYGAASSTQGYNPQTTSYGADWS